MWLFSHWKSTGNGELIQGRHICYFWNFLTQIQVMKIERGDVVVQKSNMNRILALGFWLLGHELFRESQRSDRWFGRRLEVMATIGFSERLNWWIEPVVLYRKFVAISGNQTFTKIGREDVGFEDETTRIGWKWQTYPTELAETWPLTNDYICQWLIKNDKHEFAYESKIELCSPKVVTLR